MQPVEVPVTAADGHRYRLLAHLPERPVATLLWLPALGVAARHYSPFAARLAARGVASFVHEWRGHGSSTLRAGRDCDWGYRELLASDLPASEAALGGALPLVLPRIIGGHSLGGQLACCRLAMQPGAATRLWLVASGAPYWRAFPLPTRYWLPLAYRLLPWLARRNGALPGRRIGFGGREARGLVADWARSALSGRYAAAGLEVDLDAAMAGIAVAVQAVVLAGDWLAPDSSLRFLLSKMPQAEPGITRLDRTGPGVAADHFSWMDHPEAVAGALTRELPL